MAWRIFWVLLLFVGLGLVLSAVEQKEGKSIQQVNINIEPLPDGHKLITPDDVILSIKRSFGYELPGMPLGAINVERLERVIRNDPFVIDAEVFVDSKLDVNIDITQRNPMVRIVDNNGFNYYLDENGVKMPISKHFTPRLLTATGNIPPHSPDFLNRKRHVLKDVFNLTAMIQNDPFYEPLIEQIHVSNRREFILVPKLGKQKIIFGSFADAQEKLNNLKTFYKEGLPYAGWHKYRTFNVKYKGQVVAKK